MNSNKATALPAELAMPSRIEGLLSLLIASPMTLLGCTPDDPPADPEGSSSGSSTGATGMADSGTTTGASTGDTSMGTTASPEPSTSTTDDDTTGVGTTEATTTPPTTDDGTTTGTTTGGESTTGGEQGGNTCERVGDLMDMCFPGGGYYYSYYEQACLNAITYYIAIGDLACAQAYNEFYSCIADLECAEVFMGVWDACQAEWDTVSNICWDWVGSTGVFETDTFGDSGVGWEDSGVGFIVPDTDGFGGTGTGGWGGTGGFGTDTGGFGST